MLTQKIVDQIVSLHQKYYDTNKTTIAISITAHEDFFSLLDLILNLTICYQNYNIILLLSITDNLYKNNEAFLQSIPHVRVHNIRKQHVQIWAKITLFEQHYLAYKYCIDNNIQYTYFQLYASNQLCICVITDDIISKHIISIKDKPILDEGQNAYDAYFSEFMNKHHAWVWIANIKKDLHFISIMKKYRLRVNEQYHEATIYDKFTISYVFNFYKENNLLEKSTYIDYPMEELLPRTLLLSKFNTDISLPLQWINKPILQVIETALENGSFTIKPVKRVYRDDIRVTVRSLIMHYA